MFGDIEDPESDIAKKAANATRVDETGFYYIPVNGMDSALIGPVVTGDAAVPNPKPATAVKAEPNLTPVIVGAGVVAAAAVGAGVGVAVNKSKAAKKDDEGSAE